MPRPRLELKPEDVTAIIDTREQLPLELSLPMIRGTLATGDYSVQGLEHMIAIERKSLADLVGCVGTSRERFEKEIQRLLAHECRAIVVEAGWGALELGQWRSQVTPSAALGSVLGWIAQGVPIIMAGSRESAARYVSRLLFVAARRRWRELQSLVPNLRIAGGL